MVFNSREYKWADVDIFVDGVLITKARNIDYKSAKDKEHLHARGSDPIDIVSGNKTYTGNLDILLSGLFEMEAVLGDLLEGRFDVVVSYVPKNGQQILTNNLQGCEFTEIPKGLKQGDKFREVSLPFLFLREV